MHEFKEEYVTWEEMSAAHYELLTCPFCDHSPAWLRGGLQSDDHWSYVVVCDWCGSLGPGIAGDTRSEAIERALDRWQMRGGVRVDGKVDRKPVIHRVEPPVFRPV